MTEALPRYSIHTLHDFCCRALQGVGVPPNEAHTTADTLLYADLRGIDSHGIAHLGRYARNLANGGYKAQRTISIVHETASTALIDGGEGLGPPPGAKAMALAIEKAKTTGTSSVAVRRSHHFGAAGYYASLALEHDMIGLALTNAGPNVVPTFGLQPLLGTNPIALAIPADKEPPFVLDMATSVKAVGKLEVLLREGKQAPPGWMMFSDGSMGTDPESFMQSRRANSLGGMLPLGGAGEGTAGYKGFGLGLGVELLTALLVGDAAGPFMDRGPGRPEAIVTHFFSAMRIDAFRPVSGFKSDVDRVIRALRAAPKTPGHDRIYVAGEKEFETLHDRSQAGIPLNARVIEDLESLAQELGLSPPRAVHD